MRMEAHHNEKRTGQLIDIRRDGLFAYEAHERLIEEAEALKRGSRQGTTTLQSDRAPPKHDFAHDCQAGTVSYCLKIRVFLDRPDGTTLDQVTQLALAGGEIHAMARLKAGGEAASVRR
jgi:hypothetical protein